MAKVDPRWIRTPSDELAIAEGCTFDLAAAEHVRDFLATNCRQSIGEFAGRPLELLDWQWSDIVAPLYGWKRPDGRRRFKTAYIQVAKKNGKSTLISGLSLYHLLADGENVPRCYLLACDKFQAGNIYEECSRMVEASDELKAVLDDLASQKLIACPSNRGQIITLSNVVESKDGFNASLVVFDELHRQKTPRLWNIMKYAGRSRREPIRIAITTAGDTEGIERKSICHQQYEYSKKILSGAIKDPSHLAVIYEPAEGQNADIDDPAVWHSANPSLGTTISVEDFRTDLQQAKENPSDLEEFKQLRLNIWVSNRRRFLPKARWDACRGEPVEPEFLRGLPCYAGLDLASTIDIAALALLYVDEENERFHVRMRFWVPEDNAAERETRDRVPYRTWGAKGLIDLTEGNVIDYTAIRIAIAGDPSSDVPGIARECQLVKLGYDPFNAYQLSQQLRDEDGIPLVEVRQGYRTLSAATKEVERLVMSQRLQHDGNEVLDWMCGNAITRKDPAGNIKLDKERCPEKIDGMAALVNAVAVWMAGPGDESNSVYDDRGMISL